MILDRVVASAVDQAYMAGLDRSWPTALEIVSRTRHEYAEASDLVQLAASRATLQRATGVLLVHQAVFNGSADLLPLSQGALLYARRLLGDATRSVSSTRRVHVRKLYAQNTMARGLHQLASQVLTGQDMRQSTQPLIGAAYVQFEQLPFTAKQLARPERATLNALGYTAETMRGRRIHALQWLGRGIWTGKFRTSEANIMTRTMVELRSQVRQRDR